MRHFITGTIYRSTSDRRSTISNQDTLLFSGSNPCHKAAAEREKLSHLLPNASWAKCRRVCSTESRRLFAGQLEVSKEWRYPTRRTGRCCTVSGVESMSGHSRYSLSRRSASFGSSLITRQCTVCRWTGKNTTHTVLLVLRIDSKLVIGRMAVRI